jgi:hypothetical protein
MALRVWEMWSHVSGLSRGSERQANFAAVNGMAIKLYLLELSYGAVELMLGGLGLAVSKSSAY